MINFNKEKKIVRACLKGDIGAQRQFYNLFAEKMMGLCLRYTKTTEEAEDLLQEGFLQVFLDLKNYRGEGSLEGWVRKVILNKALQYVRKKKRVFFSAFDERLLDDEAHSYQETFADFTQRDFLIYLQQLPEGCQVIFNLYVIEELTHKEIAKKLGISIGTSKSQLSKARMLLKRAIKKMNIPF